MQEAPPPPFPAPLLSCLAIESRKACNAVVHCKWSKQKGKCKGSGSAEAPAKPPSPPKATTRAPPPLSPSLSPACKEMGSKKACQRSNTCSWSSKKGKCKENIAGEETSLPPSPSPPETAARAPPTPSLRTTCKMNGSESACVAASRCKWKRTKQKCVDAASSEEEEPPPPSPSPPPSSYVDLAAATSDHRPPETLAAG